MEEENGVKKSNKRFIIKFVIFIIVLILITVGASYFTIVFLNQDKTKDNQMNNIITEEIKKEAEDKKYAVESYAETYDINSIDVITYYDIDGNIFNQYPYDIEFESNIEFVQIYGLKDANIEDKINRILKQKSYDIGGKYVYANVTANFSNILSVSIYSDEGKNIGLNFDLSNGESIPLEKVFISSATLNSYLVDGLYRRLAWSTLTFDEYNEYNDMDKIDTSEYEDKFIKLVKNYNKLKGNVQYNIFPSYVIVYGLVDESIIEADYEVEIQIDLINIANEVAIYKRYLTDKSIFKDDSLGKKNIIVFTNFYELDDYMKNISYGKISDNIFVEEYLYKFGDDLGEEQKIVDFVKKLSEEDKNELKNQTSVNQGIFFQRDYHISHYNNENYCILNVDTIKTKCPIYYFQEDAFKDYVNLKARPTAGAEVLFFNEYMKDDYPNLQISDFDEKTYYFSMEGEYLGDNKEEIEEKLRKEQEIENEIIDNSNNNNSVNEIEENIVIEQNDIEQKNIDENINENEKNEYSINQVIE